MLSILSFAALAVSSAVAQSSGSVAPVTSAAAATSAAPAAATTAAAADSSSFIPLASQHFTYTALPYKADPTDGERGPQSGYNICNSTTAGPNSQCQTAFINSVDDFCLWGPPTPNSTISDTEGQSVAWCTKADHGTRVIPPGAITGVQFMKTPAYVQVTGYINQWLIDMQATDGGGEMDPHGADNRGNPIGGLVFSDAFPESDGNNNTYIQAVEWHNFMGSGVFCFKACDPAGADAAEYCQHIYDLIGCQYNAPAAYVNDTFESCLGDNQDFPGVYTGTDGIVSTYTQPAESLGPITTMPYTARIPASSDCTTYSSNQLFASASTNAAVTTAAGGMTTAKAGGATGTGTGTAAGSTGTSKSTNGAMAGGASVGMGVGAVLLGVVVGAVALL